ncbi:MFS general substrate transporter [Amniculicola lignicola CBS 123094]|uniref:MFS general substrate transporter n=1 Tax=Amniculicola lignicola CBS 123094 TaxID=1392246 RepID=A0A6A5WT74_9PLEO|nr:MFS general substrate transporter [Amniculicola lignicola CBS 123094]
MTKIAEEAVPDPNSEERISNSNRKPLAFHMSFMALVIMVLIVSLDATALSVAIAVIAHELHGTTLEAFWASISFMLAVVIIQPVHTSLSNVLGRKTPLYASFLMLFIGSIVFAIAHSMSILILGRVLQGLGAGGLDVLSEVILADMTTLKERPLYLGLFVVPMAAGCIFGPIMGGLFSEHLDWRWIGWVNLPVAAVGFLLVLFFLKLKSIPLTPREKMVRVDWIGIALYSVGCTLFVLPVTWAGQMYPWKSWMTILPLILGTIILAVFAWYESRPMEPMFPYRIFRKRTATATLIAGTLHGAVTYPSILYTLLFFQAIFLQSPLKSAISLMPYACSSMVFSVIAAVAVELVRKYRLFILVTWVSTAVGAGLIALWNPSSSLAVKTVFQILLGIGTGALFSILMIPIQACVDVDDMGIAAGILVSFRLFGGLVGLSMSAAVFHNVFEKKIVMVKGLPEVAADLQDVREAVGFIPQLRNLSVSSPALAEIVNAYRQALIAVFLMLAGFGAIGFLLSFFIEEITLEKEELGRQQFVDQG